MTHTDLNHSESPASAGLFAAQNRFDGKSRVYESARPSYPASCLERFAVAGKQVADIGAGTGKLTAQLLAMGADVTAVEPNAAMRQTADEKLGAYPGYRSVGAAAEETGLPGGTFDLVTAAQAFHWFDTDAFQRECRRILKPDGIVLLLWNMRVPDAPVNRACEAVCRSFCPQFEGFTAGFRTDDERIGHFFNGRFEKAVCPNDLCYTRDLFIARQCSSSYAPKPQDPAYEPFTRALGDCFDRFAADGFLTVPNVTECCWGRPKKSGKSD